MSQEFQNSRLSEEKKREFHIDIISFSDQEKQIFQNCINILKNTVDKYDSNIHQNGVTLFCNEKNIVHTNELYSTIYILTKLAHRV